MRDRGRASCAVLLAGWLLTASGVAGATSPGTEPRAAEHVDVSFDVRVPMRAGVTLSGTLYRPVGAAPAPCILIATPYTADFNHDRATYLAAHGFPTLALDVRGRGDSEGTFAPFVQEPKDGYDAVEWLAAQSYCNGRVGTAGGSYSGFWQWATARMRPPHLGTIVPVAAAHAGVDFPARNNIGMPYLAQWLAYTRGHALRSKLFSDATLWNALWRSRFEAGVPFATLVDVPGGDQPALREWQQHPFVDAWLDGLAPSASEYAAMTAPVLTITGMYDDDQPGALAYYAEHRRHAPAAPHYLVIGPWDHAGTRTPRPTIGGLAFGADSLVDLPQLHVEWYRWTLGSGPRPGFLAAPVMYYMSGAEHWRRAQDLASVSRSSLQLYPTSNGHAQHLAQPGTLAPTPGRGTDAYVYDPRDVSSAARQTTLDLGDPTDAGVLEIEDGHQLVYDSAPFREPVEVAGFFRLTAWIAIDRPDTDFIARIYEVTAAGDAILLSTDPLRARHRESLRAERLVTTRDALPYVFDRFTFAARRLATGSRLRLVLGPLNSIYAEKNFNAARPVAQQSIADAQTVTVRLHHDARRRSVLVVPLAAT